MLSKNHITLLLLNFLLIIALIIGIDNSVALVTWLSTVTFGSFKELLSTSQDLLIRFLSLDIYIIFGFFFVAGIITYDIYLVTSWFSSFRFTKKSTCSSCNTRIIREERHAGDRFLSTFIKVKRYRCLGCGKEYLKLDNKKEHSAVPSNVSSQKVRS